MSDYLVGLAMRGAGIVPGASLERPALDPAAIGLEAAGRDRQDPPDAAAPMERGSPPGLDSPASDEARGQAAEASPSEGKTERPPPDREEWSGREQAPVEPVATIVEPAAASAQAPPPFAPVDPHRRAVSAERDTPPELSLGEGQVAEPPPVSEPPSPRHRASRPPAASQIRPDLPAAPRSDEERSRDGDALAPPAQATAPTSPSQLHLAPKTQPVPSHRREDPPGPLPRASLEISPSAGLGMEPRGDEGPEEAPLEVNIGNIEVRWEQPERQEAAEGRKTATGFEDYSLARRGLDRRWY